VILEQAKCRAESVSASEFKEYPQRGEEREGGKHAHADWWHLGPGLRAWSPLLTFCMQILYRGFVAIYNLSYVCP